MRRDD
ncbi:hypothetical protein D018_5201A, partial [Vibrio parahaemolyticus VP2007-007]